MRLYLFALTTVLLAFGASSSHAQEAAPASDVREGVFYCGSPAGNETFQTTSPEHAFCDMYKRRFEYRENRNEFVGLMKQRQDNYAANRQQALESYRAELEKLNATRGTEQ